MAVSDRYTLNEDSVLTVAAPGLLANDTDDSGTMTAVKVTNPLRGTLNLNPDGSFTYTPIANYSGPDIFLYRVGDGMLTSNLAIVVLTVRSVADAPVAVSQSVSLKEDTVKQITLSASDADGNPLSFAIVTPPAHGVLNGRLPNVTYTPAANYHGPDSFTFRASDGTLSSNVATVTLTVTPVNDAPVALAAKHTMPPNTTLTRQAGAKDVDGDALTYTITTQPTRGTVTLNAATGVFIYKPQAGRPRADFFLFRVTDGKTSSSSARIDIQIQ
jgi:large repetitive protein